MLLIAVALATALSTKDPDVDMCVKAAAASDHIAAKDVDRDACVCAVKQLHQKLSPSDYELHQKMVAVIASGADEKSFNAQMSDIMSKRGMTQTSVDAFLARSKKAEAAAAATCNASPLLTPAKPPK